MKLFNDTKDIVILILILSIVVFLVPYWYVNGSWGWIDYTDSGAIGDTIGGITAPFINSIAAVLVYLAFRAQIKANELLKNQQMIPYLEKMVDRLDDGSGGFVRDLEFFDVHLKRYNTDKGSDDYWKYLNKTKYVTTLLISTRQQIKELEVDHLLTRLEIVFDTYYLEKYSNLTIYNDTREMTNVELSVFDMIGTVLIDFKLNK